jgi:hypothetical protein
MAAIAAKCSEAAWYYRGGFELLDVLEETAYVMDPIPRQTSAPTHVGAKRFCLSLGRRSMVADD